VRWAGFACLVAGLFLLGQFALGMWQGYAEQQRLNRTWQTQLQARPTGAPPVVAQGIDPSLMRPVDGIDFAIQVPRLGYSAAVREGVDSTILYSGPGHYPETPWPGQAGMVGVAAHNVYWIDFPQLQPGDEVRLQTRYGDYAYRVTGSRIVNADDRTVLIPASPGYHLTLTTCWPTWAGAFATQRYVIFTDQVSPQPPVDQGGRAG
jgi:sortase A